MKKSLPMALVLAAVAVFTGIGVAQQQDKQKSPPTSGEAKPAPTKPPVPQATTIQSSKSNQNERLAITPQAMTGKVTEINAKGKTFAVAVTFSAEPMKGDFSRDTFKVGDTIDVTYTQPPGGPMEATTIKGSKTNGSYRLVGGDYGREHWVTGKVTEVNNRAKTFTIAVVFSAAKLSKLPAVGQIVDITYTETPGGGPLEASNLNLSKSNIN